MNIPREFRYSLTPAESNVVARTTAIPIIVPSYCNRAQASLGSSRATSLNYAVSIDIPQKLAEILTSQAFDVSGIGKRGL
jgi:hypothetical protein